MVSARLLTPRIKRELELWPEAEWKIEFGGRHPKMYVKIGENRRLLILSGSPSDYRADLNNAGRLRRALIELKGLS